MPDKPSSLFQTILSLFSSKEIIIAICGGFIGSFVAPWTKWHFKEKELRRESRKEKVKHWKEDILKYRDDYDSFKKTATFCDLKHKIPDEELKSFDPLQPEWDEVNHKLVIRGNISTRPSPKIDKVGRFLDIAFQLEKEWNLI